MLDVGRTLDAALGSDPLTWLRRASVTVHGTSVSVASMVLGTQGGSGP